MDMEYTFCRDRENSYFSSDTEGSKGSSPKERYLPEWRNKQLDDFHLGRRGGQSSSKMILMPAVHIGKNEFEIDA